MKSKSTRNAFTLVEILVVLSVISIMAVMVTTALRGVTATARESRTKRIISIVDSVISEQYEAFRYRPLAVEIPASEVTQLIGRERESGSRIFRSVGYEVLADESARVRLMMVRDLQRIELPDRYSDIEDASVPMFAAATLVEAVEDPQGNTEITSVREEKRERVQASVAWYSYGEIVPGKPETLNADNAKLAAYRQRLSKTRSPRHQGAECLFLILSTSFVGGEPAIAAIPASNIGDTDEDGMPEILDGWGNPLGFIRWPVGFTTSEAQKKPNIDFEQLVDLEKTDQFDLLRSDYAYATTKGPAWVADKNDNPEAKFRPWSIQPLIFSFGENEESGIQQRLPDAPDGTVFSYRGAWEGWPRDRSGTELYVGNESWTPRGSTYYFPDPYLRLLKLNAPNDQELPGELIGSNASEWKKNLREASDNITNYQLQVSP